MQRDVDHTLDSRWDIMSASDGRDRFHACSQASERCASLRTRPAFSCSPSVLASALHLVDHVDRIALPSNLRLFCNQPDIPSDCITPKIYA
jgi:hypothetical protein